jgi:flavodoxin
LEDVENWLYEDGEDVEQMCYVDKLKELKLVGEASKRRKTEFEGRKLAIEALGHSLQMAGKVIEAFRSGDEQYSHLAAADVDRVAQMVEEKRAWLSQAAADLEKTPKTKDPSVLVCQFYSERDAFEAVSKPVLNKKKPKVEPPPSPPKEDSKSGGSEDKKDKGTPEVPPPAKEENSGPEPVQVNGNGHMDLD